LVSIIDTSRAGGRPAAAEGDPEMTTENERRTLLTFARIVTAGAVMEDEIQATI
jgi:hypothetical protein